MKMKVRRKPGFLLTGRQVIKYVAIHGLTSWLMTHSRPSWATPSIEFAILPPALGRRAPKQLKSVRRRVHNGRTASAPAHISREQ